MSNYTVDLANRLDSAIKENARLRDFAKRRANVDAEIIKDLRVDLVEAERALGISRNDYGLEVAAHSATRRGLVEAERKIEKASLLCERAIGAVPEGRQTRFHDILNALEGK